MEAQQGILDYGIQIAGALGASAAAPGHQTGQHHRDARGQVKVLDFGLAKLAEWRSSTRPRDGYVAVRIVDGIVVARWPTCQPEQAEAGPLTPLGCLSVGAVLTKLLTGTRPFHGETPLSTLPL